MTGYCVDVLITHPPPPDLVSFFSSLQAVPVKLSLDALLQMPGSHVRETMRRLGSSLEECSRLSAALSCLKSATESGGCLSGWQAVSVCPSLGESA